MPHHDSLMLFEIVLTLWQLEASIQARNQLRVQNAVANAGMPNQVRSPFPNTLNQD